MSGNGRTNGRPIFTVQQPNSMNAVAAKSQRPHENAAFAIADP